MFERNFNFNYQPKNAYELWFRNLKRNYFFNPGACFDYYARPEERFCYDKNKYFSKSIQDKIHGTNNSKFNLNSIKASRTRNLDSKIHQAGRPVASKQDAKSGAQQRANCDSKRKLLKIGIQIGLNPVLKIEVQAEVNKTKLRPLT